MKIRSSFLFGIIASILCFGNAMSATKTCPAGLFCTAGGKYVPGQYDIQSNQMTPAERVVDGWGRWSDQGLCDSCAKSRSGCTYCANEYDEVWVSTWFGFYLVKNGEVTYRSYGDTPGSGAFPCPGTYPSSAAGSSSVFDCYRVVANGQKEYYKAPKNNTQTGSSGVDPTVMINTLKSYMQGMLNQEFNETNAKIQNLELKVQSLEKKVEKLNAQIDLKDKTVKANSAGIEKSKDIKINDASAMKSMRSSSTRTGTGDVDLEAAKALISAGVSK